MSIFCMNCGKELPDDSSFCLKCGKSVGGVAKPTPQLEPNWEYCEIVFFVEFSPKNNHRSLQDKLIGNWWHDKVFWAEGIGPQGTFDASEGNDFRGSTYYSFNKSTEHEYVPPPESNDPQDSAAVKKLVGYLTQQGWEPLPNQGAYWYSYKFRRKVS